MASETVSVEWLGEQAFLLKDRRGFPIVMTQPGGVNGADLLPLSLIGCSVWDVVAILRKQRQKISAVFASATTSRPGASARSPFITKSAGAVWTGSAS